jgi:hypothetical protein
MHRASNLLENASKINRGAPLASNRIGTFGAWLIQLAGQVLTGIGSTTHNAAGRRAQVAWLGPVSLLVAETAA